MSKAEKAEKRNGRSAKWKFKCESCRSKQKGMKSEEIYHNFNGMVQEVQRLMQEHYKLGKEVKMAEVRALQAQINPHFLYNTLDLINWISMDYGQRRLAR